MFILDWISLVFWIRIDVCRGRKHEPPTYLNKGQTVLLMIPRTYITSGDHDTIIVC